MDMDDVNRKVNSFIMKYSRLNNIGEDQDIFQLGFANSLFAMQLILFMEKEFDISISNDEISLDNLNTIHNICKFIMGKVVSMAERG